MGSPAGSLIPLVRLLPGLARGLGDNRFFLVGNGPGFAPQGATSIHNDGLPPHVVTGGTGQEGCGPCDLLAAAEALGGDLSPCLCDEDGS